MEHDLFGPSFARRSLFTNSLSSKAGFAKAGNRKSNLESSPRAGFFRIMLYGLVLNDTDEYSVAVLFVIMLFVVDKNVL
jgi:hypothetical protein